MRSNNLKLTAIRELTPGTTPALGAGTTYAFYVLRTTLKAAFSKSPDEQILGSRLLQGYEQDGKSVEGGFDAYLSYELARAWLDAAFCAAYQDMPWRENTAALPAQITDIDATTNTVTTVSGAAFAAGMLAFLTDPATAANNLVAKLTGGSATTAVFSASVLTDNAAPGVGTKIEAVGFEGASGDLAVTASTTDIDGETVATITSTTLDFTTLSALLRVGAWIKIGDTTSAGLQLATAACNAFVRVKSIAAHVLKIGNLPAGWAADTGSGKTLRIFCGHFVTIGETYIGTTLFETNTGLSSQFWEQFKGCAPDTIDFVTPFRKRAQMNVTKLFGLDHALLTATPDSAPLAAINGRPIMGGSHVARAGLGNDFKTFGWCPEVTFSINNNFEGIEDIEGSNGPLTYATGVPRRADYTIKGTTYFRDKTIADAYRNDTETDYYQVTSRRQKGKAWSTGLVLHASSAIITDADKPVPGTNQTWKVSFEAAAVVNATSGQQATATMFPYLA